MQKYTYLLIGLILFYLALSGKLIELIHITEPLAELFIAIIGLLFVVFSIYLFTNKE
jgi:putative effector of murein hydrolase LrgA (UPF0299 family)